MQFVTGFWYIGTVTQLILLPSGAQQSLNCDSKHDCMLHQTCHEGYCKCDPGYVEVETHCLEVRNHGETCFHDVQCVGSGILCKANETDRSVKYCYCNRSHSWHEELKQCMQKDNISMVLTSLQEQQDINSKRISNSMSQIQSLMYSQ